MKLEHNLISCRQDHALITIFSLLSASTAMFCDMKGESETSSPPQSDFGCKTLDKKKGYQPCEEAKL
jgi:hypothetical protein